MVCGFSQKEGVDYEEVFAPVARYTSIRRIIMVVVVKMGWKLHHMDMKTVDVCSFVRHRWPSRLAEDGRWWLRFPSVFSENEMMWTMVVGPPGW